MGEQLLGDGDLLSVPQVPDASASVSRRPSDLVSREDLERLAERSDGAGIAYFTAHFSLLGLGAWGTWILFPGLAFVPVMLVHAFFLGFLFSPLHECAHGTAFRTRWLNEAALWATAIVYIVPPYYFRYFHLGHHRYTQIPGMDPSLVLPEPATFRQYLWYCAGLWFFWRNVTWMLQHASGRIDPSSALYVPKGRRGLLIRESRILTALYLVTIASAFYFGFAMELLVCWLLPRVLGEPVQRILRVAEHVGCDESPDLLRNTRTTLTNRFVNAIAWQMPYHAEHHLFPNVPFHALPEAHRLVGSRVIVEPRGYIAGQREIIAWLRGRAPD